MNGLDLLRVDHQRVKNWFKDFSHAKDSAKRREIFEFIKEDLTLHMHAEEAVLYPQYQMREDFKDLIEDAYEEHNQIKGLLNELYDTQDDQQFAQKFKELVDCVEHHVHDEEDKIFEMIQKQTSSESLDVLGEKLDEAKKSELENEAA